jgi:hypothetical protein
MVDFSQIKVYLWRLITITPEHQVQSTTKILLSQYLRRQKDGSNQEALNQHKGSKAYTDEDINLSG